MSGDARGTPLLVPGVRLGSCELLCVLAQGGTSVVWLARNKGIGGFEKLVAVKTILPEHAGNARYQKLLVEEARIASEIQDPHVVQVLDLGQVGDLGYIVMELIDGESLRALLHTLEKTKKRLPIPIALRIAADVCSGLAAAHGLVRADGNVAGVVHRDVSPENVLLTSAGNACLIDFGFATERDTDSVRGATVGKPQFLAPEVADGEAADARSDLWSAGALLYYMLAGRAPYDGMRPLAALHALISHAPIPPLPDEVPEPIRAVVDQALQHPLDQRFARAVAMRKAIESASASSVGIASRGDVAAFVERVLADRIAGRRRAMERALAEAERREHVFASLMAPPEILPAGEQKTPWRQSEARQRAAESQAIPSSDPSVSSRGEPETLMKVPKKLETLRPDPSDAFAMSVAPDTVREPAPTTKHISSIPRPPEETPKKQPGTNPYGLRPPAVRRSSRPPMRAAVDVNAPRAKMPTIPPLAPPPSSSRFRASDLLASTVSSKPKVSVAEPPPETEPETIALPDRPPMAPPDVSPFKGKTERPRSGAMAAVAPDASPFKGNTQRPPSGPIPAANAIGPVLSAPPSASPSSSMAATVPLAPPLVHPAAAALVSPPLTDPPPPLVTPAPTPPPPLVLSAPPPPVVQSAPPPQLELPSFQPRAPALVLVDSINPPPPMQPVAATLDPPPLERKRTPIVLFAGAGALLLVAAAVAILVLRRGAPGGPTITAPADSGDGRRAASAPMAPSSSSSVAASDSAGASSSFGSSGIASDAPAVPSTTPSAEPSAHVATTTGTKGGGKKGLRGGNGPTTSSHGPPATTAASDPPPAPAAPPPEKPTPPPPPTVKKGEDYGF